MNLQQVALPRASSNGYVHRRVDREMGVRMENKMHSGTPAFSHSGLVNGGKGGAESPSRDRLIYVTTYLIGHRVEVHVKNGSVISGIFHAADAEKDFGIVLKMAQVIKDGSVKGHKPNPDTTKKPQTMIIPARELVQVLAKDVSLSSDEFIDGHAHERRKDFMIDSAISHSHHVELERELEPWTPDIDDQEFPELDNIFDGTWNRNWDQFETNETLFGVKSTFDEELYTTRLERGPHMRDIEREASRIAREIEGEETRDLHLAEERGVFHSDDFGLDEESRYSAVHREVDDGRFEELDNSFSDACSTETFGGSSSAVSGLSPDISTEKVRNEAQPSTTCSSVLSEEIQASQSKAIDPVDLKRLSASATSYDPCGQQNKHSSSESAVPTIITATNEPANLSLRPGSSTSSTCEHVGIASASSAPGLSPSSSIGSLSSEKSTLNPYAKEFKFNPNAKSFAPSVSLRAHTPVSEGPFYYTGNIPQMHNLPVGVGFGASFGGHQPAYNLQGAQMQSPQTYLPPNSPLYGQQMIIGQPRPVFYMPTYQPEMPYRGRNF